MFSPNWFGGSERSRFWRWELQLGYKSCMRSMSLRPEENSYPLPVTSDAFATLNQAKLHCLLFC
jgi:hypothetical protein